MSIATALFSESQSRLFRWLFGQPEHSFHLNELRRLTGLGSASLQRELRRLYEADLILSERIGNLRRFQANPHSPVFSELVALTRKTLPTTNFSRTTGDSMSNLPRCPQCNSEYTYESGDFYVCPECGHEWSKDAGTAGGDEARVVKDAHGNVLQDGDSVTVIKDLKVKGSSLVVKVGTKVKNIRLVDGDHDIDCKIDGIGAMQLKSEFVKKA